MIVEYVCAVTDVRASAFKRITKTEGRLIKVLLYYVLSKNSLSIVFSQTKIVVQQSVFL